MKENKTIMTRKLTIAAGSVVITAMLLATVTALSGRFGTAGVAYARSPAGEVGETHQPAAARRCDNSTLVGAFAVKGEGFVASGPPPAPLVPFAVVSLMTFDGNGNLTDKANVSNNGQTMGNVNAGTYSIEADCTGSMSINIPNPPFLLNSRMVLTDVQPGRFVGGFYFIGTNPGSAVTHVATRVR